jgi:hypothetical protein
VSTGCEGVDDLILAVDRFTSPHSSIVISRSVVASVMTIVLFTATSVSCGFDSVANERCSSVALAVSCLGALSIETVLASDAYTIVSSAIPRISSSLQFGSFFRLILSSFAVSISFPIRLLARLGVVVRVVARSWPLAQCHVALLIEFNGKVVR